MRILCGDAVNQRVEIVFDPAQRRDDDATPRDRELALLREAERGLPDRCYRQPERRAVAPLADNAFHDEFLLRFPFDVSAL